MSIKAVAAAIEIDGLAPATKLVLILLANRYNGDTGLCCPKQENLADEACMTSRSLRTHLKDLEQAGLICRALVKKGHGQADQTNYSFPFLDRKIFPTEDLDRKISSLRPENSGDLDRKLFSGHKEQPEGNRKEPEDAFEEAWKSYQACKLKSGQTKKDAKAQWPKAVKRAGSPERILKAIETVVAHKNAAQGFEPNLPDMFRWLQKDRWEDAERELEAEAPQELTRAEWQAAMRDFVETGTWLVPDYSPAPNEPNCLAPADMLDAWRKHYAKEQAA